MENLHDLMHSGKSGLDTYMKLEFTINPQFSQGTYGLPKEPMVFLRNPWSS